MIDGGAEERPLGLRRLVVETGAGRMVVRAGARTGGDALVLIHGAAGVFRFDLVDAGIVVGGS